MTLTVKQSNFAITFVGCGNASEDYCLVSITSKGQYYRLQPTMTSAAAIECIYVVRVILNLRIALCRKSETTG
jgi:hypothetical protein